MKCTIKHYKSVIILIRKITDFIILPKMERKFLKLICDYSVEIIGTGSLTTICIKNNKNELIMFYNQDVRKLWVAYHEFWRVLKFVNEKKEDEEIDNLLKKYLLKQFNVDFNTILIYYTYDLNIMMLNNLVR